MLIPPKNENEKTTPALHAAVLERKLEHGEAELASLLPQNPDTRDRGTADYLAWEQQLVEDLRQRPIQNAIHVLRTPLGLRVLSGETRRRAGLLAGRVTAPVTIHDYPMTEGEQALDQLLDDEMRHPLTDMERAEKYFTLMQLNNWTQGELAQHVKRSQSFICKLMSAFEKIPEDMRHMIGKGDGKIPVTGAAAIARLESLQMIREVMEISLTRNLKRDAIIVLVNQRLHKPQKDGKALKLEFGGVTATVTGNIVDSLKAFMVKLKEGIKQLERNPSLPPETLASLMGG
jgi:ParB/RepB/Spo0J family partition protein